MDVVGLVEEERVVCRMTTARWHGGKVLEPSSWNCMLHVVGVEYRGYLTKEPDLSNIGLGIGN